MKTVILAAGEGLRMRPLTRNRPKVMLPVANKPIMEHLLDSLIIAGCRQFIMVVGYKAEKVKEHFEDGTRWGVEIEYCHQPEAVGTADAVERLEDMVEDRFLVLNGDSIFCPEDIAGFLLSPISKMGLIEVNDATGLGVVETQGGRVICIHEKVSPPPTNIANAGIYLFTREIFEAISLLPPSIRGEYELPNAIQKLVDGGYEFGWQEINRWLTFSYPWDLLGSAERLLDSTKFEQNGTVEENIMIKGKVSIGSGTLVRSGSYIVGPVVIGENCDIGPGCYLRPYSSIGDGCHIGASVEIKNSIIMKNTKVPHLTYIGDSVIGENCNFGAGTQVGNLRFDHKNILVGKIDTARRKLGAIIGDNVATGINSSINPGTVIGADSVIGPGVFVFGSRPTGSRILR